MLIDCRYVMEIRSLVFPINDNHRFNDKASYRLRSYARGLNIVSSEPDVKENFHYPHEPTNLMRTVLVKSGAIPSYNNFEKQFRLYSNGSLDVVKRLRNGDCITTCYNRRDRDTLTVSAYRNVKASPSVVKLYEITLDRNGRVISEEFPTRRRHKIRDLVFAASNSFMKRVFVTVMDFLKLS